MELWDVYNEKRQPLGKVHQRGIPMKRGEYHVSVFVWVFNSKGEVLLTKRSPEKRSFPNMWALTGGAVQAGETSLAAVQRELSEETGIRAEQAEFSLIMTFLRKDYFCDVYFLKKDVPLADLTMQEGETCDALWIDRAGFEQMIRQKQIASPDVNSYHELRGKLKDWLK